VLVGSDILTNKQNRYLPATLFEGSSARELQYWIEIYLRLVE